MEKALKASKIMSLWLVNAGGVLIIASALLVSVEVVIRKFFALSLGGADELSGYAFAIASTFGFAYTLHTKANIRVDAFYNFLPSSMQTLVNFLGLLLLTGFAAVVAYMAWGLVADTITHGSHSITPMRTSLIWPQVPWLFGWLFFVLTGLIITLAALLRLLRRDTQGVEALIGIKSVDDMVKEESVG